MLRLPLSLLLLLLVVVALRLQPPSPLPSSAPASEFSADRAELVLRSLLDPESPRPAGSEGLRRMRARVVEMLTGLGLSPASRTTWSCGPDGSCAQVTNVLATLEGSAANAGAGSVLLMAHLDSVPVGSGAGDNASGVAVLLEAARALKASAPLPRTVKLLFTDGEEWGLLGAHAFLRQDAAAKDIQAVVNVEARGQNGASLMFETGAHNLAQTERLAQVLPRPVSSSLFAQVYRRLPNDTDLSPFIARGLLAVKLAFIGSADAYHTPQDSLAGLSRSSLQHQGGQALAAVRALAQPGLETRPAEDAVFFDVLGFTLVHWPQSRSFPASLILLASFVLCLALLFRQGARLGAIAAGGISYVLGVALLVCLALGAMWLAVAAGLFGAPFLSHPLPLSAAFLALGFVFPAAFGRALARVATPAETMAAQVGCWTLGAVALSVWEPAASFLLLVPGAASGVGLLAFCLIGAPAVACTLAALTAGALMFPVAWLLPEAIGGIGFPLATVMVGVALGPLAPLTVRPGGGRLLWVPFVAFALGFGAQLAMDAPRPGINVELHQEQPNGPTRLWLRPLFSEVPEELRQSAPGHGSLFPWSEEPSAFYKPATLSPLPAPEWQLLEEKRENGVRHLRGRIRSPRGASRAELVFRSDAPVQITRVMGAPFPPQRRARFGNWNGVHIATLPGEGAELELTVAQEASVTAVLQDISVGVPEVGGALQELRNRHATAIQEGDLTQVRRRLDL